MNKYKGKLIRMDLGTGGWVLETRDGDKIALYGDVDPSLADCQVEVAGTEMEGAGFMMVGSKSVEVSSVKAAWARRRWAGSMNGIRVVELSRGAGWAVGLPAPRRSGRWRDQDPNRRGRRDRRFGPLVTRARRRAGLDLLPVVQPRQAVDRASTCAPRPGARSPTA
ncbi:MAG: hypothetical protein R3F59_15450 [Myxococcota bacterium]